MKIIIINRKYLNSGFMLTGILMILLLLTACHGSQNASAQDSNGNIIKLSDYRGKWIVLNYWASWCKPCAIEIPELNAFNSSHQSKDAVVLGVNLDHANSQKLQQLVQRFAINYPVLSTDPGPELGIEHVPGLPASYLINPEGKVVKSLYGEQTQKELEFAMNLPATSG